MQRASAPSCVAARHGTQRGRLGWSEEAIRCEYRILHEEIAQAVREHSRSLDAAVVEEAVALIGRLLGQAEATSLRAFGRAR